MDAMEKSFFARVKAYRAERGQSPYLNTMSSTNNLVRSALGKEKGASLKQDFYGEKIRTVGDYRDWLRRQRALTKEYLAPSARPSAVFHDRLYLVFNAFILISSSSVNSTSRSCARHSARSMPMCNTVVIATTPAPNASFHRKSDILQKEK